MRSSNVRICCGTCGILLRYGQQERPLPELVRASLAARTAAKYRKYRNKSEHLSFSSRGFPQPALRFAGTKRPRLKSCHPEQSSGGSFLKESVGRSTRRPGWLTADTTNCPETAMKLPGGGHENCPLTVMRSARHDSVCLAASRG